MNRIVSDEEHDPRPATAIRNELIARPTLSEVSVRPYVVEEGALAAPAESTGVNPVILLHALRRNWLLGMTLGMLAAAPLAVVAWTLIKPQYKARALIRISPQHVPLLFETVDQTRGASGATNFKSYKLTQRQLLLSPQLLNNAIKKPDVKDLPEITEHADPIAWLQKGLEITFPDDAEIMQVAMGSTDGNVARKLVNAIVETYDEDVVRAERNERLERANSLESVKVEAEKKVRSKRTELRGLVEKLGSGDLSTLNLAQQAAVQQYSLIRTELTKIQFDLMRAEGELQVRALAAPKDTDNAVKQADLDQVELANSNGSSPESADAQQIVQAGKTSATAANPLGKPAAPPLDPRVAKMLESDAIGSRYVQDVERFTNLIQLDEQRLGPAAAAPYVAKHQKQLGEAQRKVAERSLQLQELLLESDATGGNVRDLSNVNLPREIQLLKAHELKLKDELKQQEAEAKKIGMSTNDVDMLRAEVEGLDKVVSRIADELERTNIELKSNSRITVLGLADLPQIGESKKRLPLAGAAGLFGLFAPLMALVALDLRRQLVNGPKTIKDQSMPVLGSLPLVPRRMMRRMADDQDSRVSVWRRRLAESVDAVTSLLLRKLESDGHRVILISSAMPGEGKSTLAEQLAVSLADSGHKTLLIDFDLRRPTLHRRFGAPMEPGVTTVLRNGAELEQAVHQGDVPNLSILTAGAISGSLLQDARSGALRALFVQARANYEVVIVDSCPLLPIMDGRLVGQYTDGAILSVIKDVSTVPNVTAAQAIMSAYGIPVFGCVVTGDSGDSYDAAYLRVEHKPQVAV